MYWVDSSWLVWEELIQFDSFWLIRVELKNYLKVSPELNNYVILAYFFKFYSFPLQVRHYYFYSVFFKTPTTKNFSYCLESDNKLPIRNEGGGHSPIAFCCAPTRTKSQNRREYYLQCKLSGVSVCILLLHKCY